MYVWSDLSHRCGRTARAGRGGRAITLVTQYDVEQFQRIEHMIGKKMDDFSVDDAVVMQFAERVGEAQRAAHEYTRPAARISRRAPSHRARGTLPTGGVAAPP